MNGATVTIKVSDQMRGEFLCRMEHHADIHLLLEKFDAPMCRYVYYMRSDRWPDWMDGVEMLAACHSDKPGLTFEPILSCNLDIHEKVKAAFAKAGMV